MTRIRIRARTGIRTSADIRTCILSRASNGGVLLLTTLLAGAAQGATTYTPAGFLEWPPSAKIGALSSVAVSGNHIYVLHRGEPPILKFDNQGKFLQGFGEGLFKVAHGLRVDSTGAIWTTDNGNHVIRKFSPEGKLLLTLGEENVGGAGPAHFRSPDDIVISSKGDLYIADSGNGRIVRLTSAGRYVSEWGSKGTAAGEFKLCHGLAIDSRDHIYVADRGNNRVQVFDPKGKQLHIWQGFGNPYGLLISGKELLVSEGEVHKIFHVDPNGKVISSWGGPGILQLPHFMAIDSQGVLYVAEVDGKRVQKFTPQ
jgi:DNA-binding beta-propeller fold protein YncE